MARLPTSFATNYPITPPLSPAASEEDISTQLVTQTAGHPYIGQVRMRHKAGVQPVRENGNIPDTQPSYEMMSLKAELESARTELNRRTVVFSNHYTNMVEKWKTEKTKREVAENVAVEKARDNMVLQRTHFSLKQRAKKSSKGVIDPPLPKGTEGAVDSNTVPKGTEEAVENNTVPKGTEGAVENNTCEEKDLIGLTEENQKLTLEIQDLKETVKLLETQIYDFRTTSEGQEQELDEMHTKLTEIELELKLSKSYMVSAQQQYRNLAGRLHDERGKREIAENVAVSKARELDVQKRTSVMVMSSLSQSICIESISATGQIQGPTDTLDYATRISSLEAEVEDLRESRVELEAAITKYETKCSCKDEEIKQLREKVFLGSLSGENANSIALTQSVAIQRTYQENNEILSQLSTESVSPLLVQSGGSERNSIGAAVYYRPGTIKGGTMDRHKYKKLSGNQSKEQLQQELKSKEAMINVMKEKLELMKLQGSREDPGLEVERRELEDQVGGLDRKLSSMNTEEKENENEVDELREKLENVEKKAADFEEKNRYYQELLNKMNRSSSYQSSPRLSPTTETASPVNIPPPPPNLPPPPPPPLPEGLFGPATPQLVIQRQGQRSSLSLKSDTRVGAMNELMSMLSSGKVHLKRAKNKVPAPREDPPPLILPHAMLRRQITAPTAHENLQSSLEIASPQFAKSSLSAGTIDERLKMSRLRRESSERSGGSELFLKLNKRYKDAEESTNLELPKIDSSPLPPLTAANSESRPKPVARRKVTPVPSCSPVLSRKLEDIVPIVEEQEPPTPPQADQSLSPVKQLVTPIVSPNKPKVLSPLARQSSSEQTKPPVRTPILPPSNRDMVHIAAKPKPELKRDKSGSNPIPVPSKPSKLKSIFRKEGKSSSTETQSANQTQRFARVATEGDIDSENVDSENSSHKVKVPQAFVNN